MSYKGFTFKQLKEQFNLQELVGSIFPSKNRILLEPSDWLRHTLEIASQTVLTTEKERSERVISPILLELREKNHRQFSLFSGWQFDVDIAKGLNGECDFLLSKVPFDLEIQAPVFALVEAKKGEIESGLPQCAAQMVAAKLFNEREGRQIQSIFGCVTTGDVWRFLKLDNQDLMIDIDVYYFDNLPLLLGILQTIINSDSTPSESVHEKPHILS